MKSSITDKPRNVKDGDIDTFGIEPFEKGLTNFIETSNTPITIALQGEWGSGKTSLMNSLEKNLGNPKEKQNSDSKFHSVWLNTWEYALMKDAQSTLMDIIMGLIKEVTTIARIDESVRKKIITKGFNITKNVFRKTAQTIGNNLNNGLGDAVIDEFISEETNGKISAIRTELENIIEACIGKDSKQGFIFFIDDLDRIDPPVAVQLLELLKNIFTLENCVFVLAIDYDVVVKGLEPKFGKLCDSNEREFRSFFDKIIQVPFSMPVSSYEADKFLKASLLSTNYLSEKQSNNKDLIKKLSEISDLSVGKNPRALKRLMNSLSLIKHINSVKGNSQEDDNLNEELELLINFALVSIQIAYPPVYKLLSMHPGFDEWNESVALKMNLSQLDQQSIDKLNNIPEFDEEWEQVLFRLCENDHYLKKRALSISRLLNTIINTIKGKEEQVEDVVGAVISLSSVTNLEAFDKPIVDYHRGNLLKGIRNRIFTVLKTKLPENKENIKQIGSRIQSNFKFTVFEKGDFHMKSYPTEDGINLLINTNVKYGENVGDLKADLENKNLLSDFESIANEYDSYFQNNSIFKTYSLFNLGIWRHKKIDHGFINFHSDLVLNTPADFYTKENIEAICNQIIKLNDFRSKVQEIANKRNNT